MRDHAAASKHFQSVKPRVRTLLIAFSIVTVFACEEPPPNFGLADPSGPPSTWHTPDTAITSFCAAIEWNTCSSWLMTDDQQLNRGDGKYGPYAFIAPSPALAGITSSGGFVNETVVAAIHVDAPAGTTLPPSYQALQLAPQWNCVYLRSQPNWEAKVTRSVPGSGGPCPAVPSGGSALRVIPVSTPGYSGPAHVPAVARFHEGTGRVRQQPFFGLKCGDSWCMILPDVPADTLPLPHKDAVAAERRWLVRGWHDSQHLAVPGSAGLVLSPEIAGTAAPGPAAEFESDTLFERGFVPAVTVHFRNPPRHAKYADSWKFRQGENVIWITKKPDSDQWAGRIRVPGPGCETFPNMFWCYEDLHVARVPHPGQKIPATARFRWDENDEGLWVRCADGCCKVSGT